MTEQAKTRPLRPRRLQRILRIGIAVFTAGLLVYGVMRFSLLPVPETYRGSEFTPGVKVIVDKWYLHARGLAVGDRVIFRQEDSEKSPMRVGRIVSLPGSPDPVPQTAPKGKKPGENAILVIVDAAPERPGDPPPAIWILPSAILARVVCQSPF